MPIKLYVGNLPDNTQRDTLEDLFGGYGNIKELDIIKNFAFVHFDNDEDANQAVKDLNDTKLLGQVISVQVSKKQTSSNRSDRDRDRDRDRNRRDDRKQGLRRGPPNNRGMPPLGGMGGPNVGGILGAAPGAPGLGGIGGLGANPLGGLGILSAVNTLAVAAEQQRQEREKESYRGREREQPDPDVRVRREVVHTNDVPNASKLGLTSGYVIYERYYVDPSHPLLKGLPLPDLPRMSDTAVSQERDYYRQNEAKKDGYFTDPYRDRSPLQSRNDYDRLMDCSYDRMDYFDRR